MTDASKIAILPGELLPNVLKMRTEEYRLIQICSTRTKEGFDLVYSFGKEYDMTNLIFSVGEDDEVISISDVFPPAFLYENEIHDLFGINIKMMNVDYKGNLYRLSQKTPYKNI